MKHLFFINPAAGKQDCSELLRQEITAHCQRKLGLVPQRDFEVRISQAPGEIARWAGEAAASGQALRLYACGGDGTLNEMVSGAAGHANVAVTHLPCGSGNDFVKLFSDPTAFSHLPALMDDPEEAAFDLIDCNGHIAINTCSLGLDARIGTDMTKYKRIPLLSGSQAYLLSALVNTVKGVHRHYRINIDHQEIDGSRTMIFVGNGRWYGGGFQPVPDADPADGKLDVLLVEAVSRLRVMQVIGPYKEGRFRDYPNLIHHYRTDKLHICCDRPEPFCLDGELHMAQEATIQLIRAGIRVFYPRGLTWKTPACSVK